MEIKFTETQKTLNEYGRKITDLYRSKMASEEYNPSDRLMSDLSYEVVVGTDIFSIDIHVADYWYYAENGRGPGKMPPEQPIIKWIEWKKIVPHPVKLASGKQYVPSVKSLAYLIRRKIGKEGTEGKHLFQKTKEEIMNDLKTDVSKAIKTDFEAYYRLIRKSI